MPLVRRKKVVLHDIPDFATPDAASTSSRDVFYIPETGEIFPDYESYSVRMAFYNLKVFQCELTGKSGLDYFQALQSERSEAITLHARFPSQLKGPVLSSVQWQIMGRLDHLVELVYERFVNRYFAGEKVFVDVEGEKYYARITKVTMPQHLTNGSSSSSDGKYSAPHTIGVDLSLPIDEAVAQDDPMAYVYGVRMIEDADHSPPEGTELSMNSNTAERMSTNEREVTATGLSRDRLSFSKSILRRFIRDCVDRDAAVASPWTVKRLIAEQYGVATDMPEDIRKAIDGAKAGEKEKRKKVWEDKHEAEGIPPKRRKKDEPDSSQTATPTPVLVEMKPKPKGPVKYPIDDLDVVITDREKKAGKQVARPPLDRDLPFEDHFEPFLMAWAFFQSFGAPLRISTFTIDDFENALRHNIPDVPCVLLAEVHHCLLYAARERVGAKYIALESLEHAELDEVDVLDDSIPLVPIAELSREAKGLGYRPHPSSASTSSDGTPRPGWEDNIGIYIRDHATVHTLPNLRRILQSLMFEPVESKSGTTLKPCPPAERYPHLLPEDKLGILSFLIEICTASRVIRSHVEWADSSLTELRKEKIEVNREKRRLVEEIALLDNKLGPVETNGTSPATPDRGGTATPLPDGSSPVPGQSEDDAESRQNGNLSDATDDVPITRRKRPSSLRRASGKFVNDLHLKVVGSHGKERAQARIKAAELKSTLAERRKLDEDLNRQERRLEAIEREFRQLFGVGRTRHLGKDRFFNRYWWLDGMGSGQLISSNGTTAYGTGRLFVQGPNPFDLLIIESRGQGVVSARQNDEEAPHGPLAPGAWAVYSDPQEIEDLVAWLNVKGQRELSLKNVVTKWMDHIVGGMKRRQLDISSRPERRSTRGTKSASLFGNPETLREAYLGWTNRHVVPQRER